MAIEAVNAMHRLLYISLVWTIAAVGISEGRSSMTPGNPADEEQQNQSADSALAQRLAQAEAVISGTVTAITAAPAKRPPFLSQHDPDWWQATVAVESVEKGNVAGKTATIFFANSSDVAWYKAPKLAKGDHGVWLLQNKDSFGKPTPGPAVIDPLDSRPVSELPKARTLLKKK